MMDEHAVSDGLSAPGVRRRRSTLGNVETDAELLGGLQRGDEQAFVMLCKGDIKCRCSDSLVRW